MDFALVPGSTSNVVNQILRNTSIPDDHKKTILAAKSWGMNTSYGVGDVFAHAIEGGDTLTNAVKKEIEMLSSIYDHPHGPRQNSWRVWVNHPSMSRHIWISIKLP